LFRNTRAFQEFGNVGLEERGKLENPEKNHLEQSREPRTNSMLGLGIEPQTNWWKTNAPATAPSPQNKSQKSICVCRLLHWEQQQKIESF